SSFLFWQFLAVEGGGFWREIFWFWQFENAIVGITKEITMNTQTSIQNSATKLSMQIPVKQNRHMLNTLPSAYKTYFMELHLARLHVLEAGQGEPLIMVPATISELENWRTLAQFMAQWFHVYFFELPGHGQSEPFRDGFSSQKVARLVAQLADELGYQRFNLMGFSFGGILAMQTFKLLSHRIDRMILIAPCLGHRALPFSKHRFCLIHQ